MLQIETDTDLKSVLRSMWQYVCREHGRIEWHNFDVQKFQPGNWLRPDGKYEDGGVPCTTIVAKAGEDYYRFIYDLKHDELFFVNNHAPQ